jgi:LPS-assembly lipoprotein
MSDFNAPPAPTRRHWLTGLAALGATALLPGCGFALRQTPPLPFRRIALTGFDARSPLAAELRERLAPSAQVVDVPGQAEVVLMSLLDKRERSVVASTAAGQVRELQLRVRFEFQLSSPGGRMLIAPTELVLRRDMSYSETAALGKAQEEAELMAAMQGDIVQQVLRRLAQANPATPAARP